MRSGNSLHADYLAVCEVGNVFKQRGILVGVQSGPIPVISSDILDGPLANLLLPLPEGIQPGKIERASSEKRGAEAKETPLLATAADCVLYPIFGVNQRPQVFHWNRTREAERWRASAPTGASTRPRSSAPSTRPCWRPRGSSSRPRMSSARRDASTRDGGPNPRHVHELIIFVQKLQDDRSLTKSRVIAFHKQGV